MKHISWLFGIWLCGVAALFGGESASLTNARRAQALLGADVWSQVVRVENTGSTGRYGRTVHALVFELAGILWFYTDADGTQSFSTFRGRLEADKADFGPLLKEIHPGFVRWSAVPSEAAVGSAEPGELRNGCFVESVANLRRCLALGGVLSRPQLLSYYTAGVRIAGHTVLTFETSEGLKVIDPVNPGRPITYPRESVGSAEALAKALVGPVVKRAVWVPLGDFAATLAVRFAGGVAATASAMD
jgi:hypothetical protein